MHRPPECRHPDRYEAPDRFATEYTVTSLIGALVAALRPDVAIEVGSYEGHTSHEIGLALKAAGRGHLHTVEAVPDRAAKTRERVKGLPVTVHNADFAEWIPPVKPINFAFVDGTANQRERDLRRVLAWSRPGAIIAVHDTAKVFKTFDLIRPVIQEGRLRTVFLPTLRGLALAEVLPNGN